MIIKRKIEKSSRSFRVSENIRKAISKVLIKNELPLETPFTFPINVVRVEMNKDLKIAYIYVTTHQNLEEQQIINNLNLCKKYLSREVTSLISLKFSPKLVFRYDQTINEIDNIKRVLNSEKVLKDLKDIDLLQCRHFLLCIK